MLEFTCDYCKRKYPVVIGGDGKEVFNKSNVPYVGKLVDEEEPCWNCVDILTQVRDETLQKIKRQHES